METLANSVFIIGAISLLTTVACSKSEQKKEVELKNNSVFEDFATPVQKFFISNEEDTTITGEKGTIIFIPKGAYDAKEKDIIELTLIEYYDKSDMLMEGLTTMTEDGKISISGGMIYLSASDGGTDLKINSGKELSIFFNQDYNKGNLPMKPFLAYPNSREPGSGEILNWVIDEEGITTERDRSISKITLDNGQEMTSEIVELDNRFFKTTKLQWIHSYTFYEYDNATNIAVELDNSLPVAVRLVFLERNSIMPGFMKNDGNYHFGKAPVGERVAILVFSKIDDQYFLAIKRITIKENHPVEELTLQVVRFDDLKEELKKFN